ncbi:MAG TPA: protein-glutamate O-methyltransferase CheR [Nitrospirota bacterium]|nr:protein-glutamate O-methyltransferase CheR [Nitrospirota bacterium]
MNNDAVKAMSAKEFGRLSEFIVDHCGIKMPPAKQIMLESRLQKRLRVLGMSSFRDYCDHVLGSEAGADELVHMIDAVTTNKTDFFREPYHFQFLAESVLPEFLSEQGGARKHFQIWSAGCSSGEEPYTLAIAMSEFAIQRAGFQYGILATDISSRVLDKARLGIYDEHLVAGIPLALKQRYFLRSKDRGKALVRVAPELRSHISFQRVNLMDEHLSAPELMDAIFCRNVIIYFERATQYRLLGRLCRCLKTNGHLFLGHSETVHGFDLPLVRISSTIYRKVA